MLVSHNITLIKQLSMKFKLKKIWKEHMEGISLGIAFIVLVIVMLKLFRVSHNADETLVMESTSENAIKAKTFDYKGHQYILFEEARSFGASSFLHSPDCKKCKSPQ